MQTAQFGTVISGTLLTSDLLPAFMDELMYHDEERAHQIAESYGDFDFDGPDYDDDTEAAQWIIDDLMDALNEYAPTYGYFGAHAGDASDFGFWPDWDSINEAVHSGELAKIDDPCQLDLIIDVDEALHVSDHGNATLYVRDGVDWREAWSIV